MPQAADNARQVGDRLLARGVARSSSSLAISAGERFDEADLAALEVEQPAGDGQGALVGAAQARPSGVFISCDHARRQVAQGRHLRGVDQLSLLGLAAARSARVTSLLERTVVVLELGSAAGFFSVMSRTTVRANSPSGVSTGPTLISTGNSSPSGPQAEQLQLFTVAEALRDRRRPAVSQNSLGPARGDAAGMRIAPGSESRRDVRRSGLASGMAEDRLGRAWLIAAMRPAALDRARRRRGSFRARRGRRRRGFRPGSCVAMTE